MATQTDTLDWLRNYFQTHNDTIRQDFLTFLRFPSISTDPTYKEALLDCKKWLQNELESLNFEVEEWATSGHPTLFATFHVDANKPTLLIYNHYDVQPVDPLELWDSPPFEPEIRNGEVYARGAQDNKGQCFYVLLAMRALLQRDGSLPCNIKWVIEGEEEIGSSGLSGILEERKESLLADALVVADVGLRDRNSPAVTLGMRGITTMEVTVTGSNSDLHSGMHGGMVMNPNHALVDLLSKLRDADGRVTVPHFYDEVRELTEGEQEALSFAFDQERYEEQFATKATGGEKGFSPVESLWIRPTLEINGITGGYSGPGFKTVIPAQASAKISCRLVPDQDPIEIQRRVKAHIESLAPEGVSVEVELHEGSGEAVWASPESSAAKAFAGAYQEVFNKPCDFILEGGSIPIVAELSAAAEAEVVLIGYGLPDDAIHAPNEHFGLDRLELGMLTVARAMERF